MAQPPLSQQIRTLELELSVQLFERDKRPLQLTHAGQAFLKQAQLVLTQVEQATLMAQQANRGEVGRLAIGFNSTVTQSVLPAILNLFQTRFPQVQLSLCELNSQTQIQRLDDRTIDCGFLNAPIPSNSDLNGLSVYSAPISSRARVLSSSPEPLPGQWVYPNGRTTSPMAPNLMRFGCWKNRGCTCARLNAESTADWGSLQGDTAYV